MKNFEIKNVECLDHSNEEFNHNMVDTLVGVVVNNKSYDLTFQTEITYNGSSYTLAHNEAITDDSDKLLAALNCEEFDSDYEKIMSAALQAAQPVYDEFIAEKEGK